MTSTVFGFASCTARMRRFWYGGNVMSGRSISSLPFTKLLFPTTTIAMSALAAAAAAFATPSSSCVSLNDVGVSFGSMSSLSDVLSSFKLSVLLFHARMYTSLVLADVAFASVCLADAKFVSVSIKLYNVEIYHAHVVLAWAWNWKSVASRFDFSGSFGSILEGSITISR